MWGLDWAGISGISGFKRIVGFLGCLDVAYWTSLQIVLRI